MISNSAINPLLIIRQLTALPHRGATTQYEKQAADILQSHLIKSGATVERQPFKIPKTYIYEVWWLLSGLIAGLLLIPVIPWIALGLVIISVLTALHYFDWRSSPISLLPPRGTSENIIAKKLNSDDSASGKKLILMAHYDSAPNSYIYRSPMIKDFHRSLLISLGVMVATIPISIFDILNFGEPLITWLRLASVLYFLAQGVLSSIDFLRFGFTNGASDNATGTAIAIATADHFWQNPIPGMDIELVLTGAEEAGMKGARSYFVKNKKNLNPQNTYVLNFDNLGKGKLKVITRTGSIIPVKYDNLLVNAALNIASTINHFSDVKPGSWHTGDFDSLWFARAGIPSLTLSAQDDEGLIPNLHRPSDTIENMDHNLPEYVVEFAIATIKKLADDF
jgi:hypothetical protein